MNYQLLDNVNLGLLTVFPVLQGVAAVLCLAFRRVSNWLLLAGAGFLGMAGTSSFRIVGTEVMRTSPTSPEVWQLFTIGCNTVALALYVVIVAGLALGLNGGARKVRLARAASNDGNRPPHIPETRSDWIPRNEGSRDIRG